MINLNILVIKVFQALGLTNNLFGNYMAQDLLQAQPYTAWLISPMVLCPPHNLFDW